MIWELTLVFGDFETRKGACRFHREALFGNKRSQISTLCDEDLLSLVSVGSFNFAEAPSNIWQLSMSNWKCFVLSSLSKAKYQLNSSGPVGLSKQCRKYPLSEAPHFQVFATLGPNQPRTSPGMFES